MEKREVEPASIPLPMADEMENRALSMQNGSEDLIIHDSEEELDGLSPGPRFNIAQYVYSR
jgi:exonuclease-1